MVHFHPHVWPHSHIQLHFKMNFSLTFSAMHMLEHHLIYIIIRSQWNYTRCHILTIISLKLKQLTVHLEMVKLFSQCDSSQPNMALRLNEKKKWWNSTHQSLVTYYFWNPSNIYNLRFFTLFWWWFFHLQNNRQDACTWHCLQYTPNLKFEYSFSLEIQTL